MNEAAERLAQIPGTSLLVACDSDEGHYSATLIKDDSIDAAEIARLAILAAGLDTKTAWLTNVTLAVGVNSARLICVRQVGLPIMDMTTLLNRPNI